LKIKDGGGRCFEKSKNRHISATDGHEILHVVEV